MIWAFSVICIIVLNINVILFEFDVVIYDHGEFTNSKYKYRALKYKRDISYYIFMHEFNAPRSKFRLCVLFPELCYSNVVPYWRDL